MPQPSQRTGAGIDISLPKCPTTSSSDRRESLTCSEPRFGQR